MANGKVFINFEEGVKRVMNNKPLFVKLLGKFASDASIKEFDAALTEKDFEKAKVIVHTLKGVAANLSLTELNKHTIELEVQLKNGKADSDMITMFKNVYSETKDEVQKVIVQHG